MTDLRDPEITEAQEARFLAAFPKLVDLILDLVEGRKFVAIETTQSMTNAGPIFTTTAMICDNPSAPPAEAAAALASDVHSLEREGAQHHQV